MPDYHIPLFPDHTYHLLGRAIDNEKIFKEEINYPFIIERFSNWLNSYTKAFNKTYTRKGSLFIDYLRRSEIQHNEQLGGTIFYIHKNPVHHSYCKLMEEWHWSSYNAMLSNAKSLLLRKEVLEWFDSIDGFSRYHQQPSYLNDAIILE